MVRTENGDPGGVGTSARPAHARRCGRCHGRLVFEPDSVTGAEWLCMGCSRRLPLVPLPPLPWVAGMGSETDPRRGRLAAESERAGEAEAAHDGGRPMAASSNGAGSPAELDRGCEISRRCVRCPLRTCVFELPTSEREAVRAAWRLLVGYVAPSSTD